MNVAASLTLTLSEAWTRFKEGTGHWEPGGTDETAAHAVKMLRRVDRIAMSLFVTSGAAVLVALLTMIPAVIATAVTLGVATLASFIYADHGTNRWREADARWVWHDPRGR